MSYGSRPPYWRIASVALVASAIGVASILLPMGEMDDFIRSYWLVAIVSVGTRSSPR